MADDLTRPYIGYRSAGRRPERQQDRRASADAPLAALRGMVSGVLGAPGDIESLVRMLPGLSEQTMLPTSEDVERRLPLRSVSETPAGRAFTTAGQLGGGFYTGPGSPLRAIAGLPSAVSRAGRDFAMASGQPAVNVVKPKGGNWLAGSVERAIEPMRQTTLNDLGYANLAERAGPEVAAEARAIHEPRRAMNRWLETKLAKYIKNEMGTPEDPIRALAERGVLHYEPQGGAVRAHAHRSLADMPTDPTATGPLARAWEDVADAAILPGSYAEHTPIGGFSEDALRQLGGEYAVKNPQAMAYSMDVGTRAPDLGFSHLADELRNAINPDSGLPENLRWKYQDLEKVTVPQAVQRVADINAWRAAQKAEADAARAMNPATHVFKEYPEQGFKWVELKPRSQDELIQKAADQVRKDMPDLERSDPAAFESAVKETAYSTRKIDQQPLEDALKYEGETMGHCVGEYCPDVIEGRSKIFSLRDKKGQPHVTIEVAPGPRIFDTGTPDGRPGPEEIVQIKGKANRAPNPEYLPAVQDFVRSQNWSNVGDLKNTGLVDLQQMGVPAEMRGGQRFVTEDEYKDIVRKNAEGFAEGGLVGGANSPTLDFDPARIDTIVGELHALNAG